MLNVPTRIGTLSIWVSNKPKRLNWSVVINPPFKATGFNGTWSIANLSSGSVQRVKIKGRRGNISQPMLKSKYGGILIWENDSCRVCIRLLLLSLE
ncbi:Hypothetical gene [Listeria ivanovii subsp. ivanovii PAM 55]|uniref:Uncharacterized protein n=1 Tax=Listeria ivanovii (strain ATCC BAA-678 / PAM 55) TaxID=881621 RepID=G2ZCB1_LISIP|nr:Hypothetical gene [Listeria ivanovii subsp. ivanovii PAM 55]SNV49575.1 Uncharacterised protein [Listeria ivanovii subsp. ivanovii]SNV99426.1 Uncharacterised protein [Listeria ivanovii subsp. ivanovii]